MKKRLSDLIRCGVLKWFEITGRLPLLFRRAWYTEIGLTGCVSELDRVIAEREKLRPLNRFERWLLHPWIQWRKEVNWKAFRRAVIEVTGEDPENWFSRCI